MVVPATLDLANFSASDGVIFVGAPANDIFDITVSGAGDVNGDRIQDSLIFRQN